MKDIKIGFALCASHCTYDKVLPEMKRLCDMGAEVIPIMSERSFCTDTRFGDAGDFVSRIEEITGKKVIKSVKEAEPIGPKALLDVLVIAPCTGNTVSKITAGVTDSSVAMACKAHLRNNRPVVIAISTNDALSGSASNIGALLNRKNFYFVPFSQDDPINKPFSAVADMEKIPETIAAALKGEQFQPLLSR